VIVQSILVISITIQLIAAVLALRLTRLTGPQRAWLLIAAAVVSMAARRAITLYFALNGHHNDLPGVASEVVGLVTSVLMLLGIAAVEPLVRALRGAQEELEKRVNQRTAELTRANGKLQTSEARYRAIVEDQTDLICRYLPDRTLTFVNGAYCRMRGLPREELLGHDFMEFVPEEDQEHIKHVLTLLSVDNPMLVAEHHQTTAPEGETWRQWTRRATFDEAGRIVEIQAVGRDTTRQRLMEEVVREREANLRRLVENLPVMVDALDENGVIMMWNRECERVTGYTAAEIVGNPDGMRLLYPDADYLHDMQALFDQLGGDFRDWEVTLTAKDGTLRIIAWSNVSKRYPISGWQTWAIGVDVTRRKQIEKALHEAHEALERRIGERTAALRAANEALQREITERQRVEISLLTSQTMLRMTIDALSDTVHVIDQDMRITLYNEAFRQMNQDLGLETRAIGRTPFELFPFLNENVRAEYQHVFESGQVLVTEESTTVGSMILHTETRKIPVFDGDQVTHVVTVTSDVTERKQAEQEILQFAIEKERSEILAAFVQDVSHEFANPISVIKNSIYLALNTADPDRRARHLEVLNGQIFHVEKLVEGLLTMSRLDSGFPFRCEPVPLGVVLEAINESLETATQQKNHTLVPEWADDLPPVMGDQKYLHLALRQLVDNAVQYTPPGGTITVRAVADGDQVVIEVSDTGIGIAPEHLDAIFQRFFRVERARTERGAGLGLPIARAIIERHGGAIEVESTLDAGSLFRVFLPISGC
jgi:two-component system, sporulation sensor kinase E